MFSEKGIKPSLQRIKIMDFLMGNKTHPTVDTIYKHVVTEIPTLSKTTVYNTLKLLASKDLILTINIEDTETRYDADTEMHGHFKCFSCQQVYDFKLDTQEFSTNVLGGFDIDEHHIYLKGVCSSCKSKNESQAFS
jgi:Fur family peroxide stress response transcriptional regulator